MKTIKRATRPTPYTPEYMKAIWHRERYLINMRELPNILEWILTNDAFIHPGLSSRHRQWKI